MVRVRRTYLPGNSFVLTHKRLVAYGPELTWHEEELQSKRWRSEAYPYERRSGSSGNERHQSQGEVQVAGAQVGW